MTTPTITENSAAALIARFLKARGVDRVFALCGGHIMPIWMRLDAEGIRIVDVRDERAAVYMAHAHAELTGGLGVALVTAGPGVTNAMTGIANAHVARAPVLVLSGTPPRRAGEPRRAAGHGACRVRAAAHALCAHRARAGAGAAGARRGGVARIRRRAASRDRCISTSRPTRCAARCRARVQLRRAFRAEARGPLLPDPDGRAGRGRAALVGAAAAGHHRPRRARRRRAAVAAARPPRRALPRHRREPRPGARRPSVGRRRDARHGDEPGRRGGDGRPPARLPARLRLAGGVRRRAASCASPTAPPSCATTGAARSRCSRTPAARARGDRSRLPATARRQPTANWARGAARAARRARRQAAGVDGNGARRQRRPMHPEPPARRAAASSCRRRRDRRRRRRRLPQLRARRPAGEHLSRPGLARLHRRRHAVRHRREPGAARTARSSVATGDGASASTRWRSTPRRATRRRCSSSSPTTAPGRSRCTTRQETHGKVVGTAPAVRRPRGDGARLRPAWRARRARRGPAGGDRPRAGRVAHIGRRCSTCWSRRRRCPRTPSRAWPGCPTCSRSVHGTTPSASGGRPMGPAPLLDSEFNFDITYLE